MSALENMRGAVRNLPSLFRFLSLVFRHIRIKRISGTITFGLSNPADTGILYGYYCSVSPVFLVSDRIGFIVKPVFDRETLVGEIRLEAKLLYPISVIAGGARYFLDPATRAMFRGPTVTEYR